MFFFGKKRSKPKPLSWERQRARMVARDLEGRDIIDPRVLDAMNSVPRERFLPEDKQELSYADHAVPIGLRQTISQPYIVALTMQLAEARAGDRALEIGCGSGYAAAVLSHLVEDVTTVEIIPEHADAARTRLEELHLSNVEVILGDGTFGYAPRAPYDVIVSAAAPQEIPESLLEQLAPGGRLVIPVGAWQQKLVCVRRNLDGTLIQSSGIAVSFVPMTGAAWVPPDDSHR